MTNARVTTFAIVLLILPLMMWVMPLYNVWNAEQRGRAQLAEAEYSKKVAVQVAIAKQQSASYEADAEVVRAGGVAKANQIIGESLKNNEDYLRYLWIDTMKDTHNQVIYVPTETNLPILEASREVARRMHRDSQ